MIARKTLLPLANVFLGAILGLVALKVIAVYLGRSAYGEYEGALAILGIIYVFADLSMGEAHVKRVSEGQHAGDCFVTFAVFRLVASFLFILLCTGAYFFWTIALGQTLEDASLPVLGLVMLFYVLKGVQNIAQSTFDARLEMARSQLGSLVETVVRVVSILIVAAVFTALVHRAGPLLGRIDTDFPLWTWIRDQPAAALALANVLGALAASVVTFYYIFRILERGRFRWDLLRSYFAFALPLFAASAMGIVSFFIDRAMLLILGTDLDTANFAGPRRIVSVIEGIGVAVGLLLFPTLSGMFARSERDLAHEVVDKSLRYLSILLVPTIAFIVFFPKPVILIVLGAEWLEAAPVLSILSIWVLVHVLSRPQGNLILGSGGAGTAARIGILTSIINILLNLVLIPDDIRSLGITLFGLKALGAAIATLVASSVAFLLIHYAASKQLGYVPRVPIWKHFVAAGVMVGALYLLDLATPFHLIRWYSLLGYVLVGAVVYALALVPLRELTRADIAYVMDVLSPRELLRYIRFELFQR